MKTRQSNNPHDQVFKELLRQKVFAKAFIEQHFSKEELAHLDLSTLELWNASFVHYKSANTKDTLRLKSFPKTETHSDVVYRVKTKNQKDCYIVLLFEHQSTPNKMQAFRVLEYEVRLMRQHLNQGCKKLPVIMTAVFYHGASPYPYSTNIFDCFEAPEIAKEYYLQPFKLIDVKQIPDEELKKNIVTAPLQIIMKHIRDNDLLPTLVDLSHSGILSENATLNRGKLFSGVLEYAISVGQISDKAVFGDLLLNQPNEMRRVTMTKAEFTAMIAEAYKRKCMREGMQEGIQKGIQKGMQEGVQQGIQQEKYALAKNMLIDKLSFEMIEKYTGLSVKTLENMEAELGLV